MSGLREGTYDLSLSGGGRFIRLIGWAGRRSLSRSSGCRRSSRSFGGVSGRGGRLAMILVVLRELKSRGTSKLKAANRSRVMT